MGKVVDFCKPGVSVRVGCHGVNSGGHKDVFRVMYLAATVPNDARTDASGITAEEVIEMATLHGYRAIGWDKELGVLEAGRKADLILIDIDRPEFVPTYNYVYSLVYTASGDCVDTTIVDGKILMENRELTTIDLAEVRAHCRELAPKLLERSNVKPVSRWPIM